MYLNSNVGFSNFLTLSIPAIEKYIPNYYYNINYYIIYLSCVINIIRADSCDFVTYITMTLSFHTTKEFISNIGSKA